MRTYFLTALILLTGSFIKAQPAYKSDNVSFKNNKDKITIGGTLTLPSSAKPCAAVVIISGTGQQDRDGNMGNHKLFLDIADYLTKQGIAVLRMDDRGIGKTNGNYQTSTTADFADDALSAVDYLRTRNEIDTAKIGLMGHSEGGAVISIAASQSNKIKFLISIAGLAMGGYEAQLRQNEDLVNAGTQPDYDKKRGNEIDSIMFGVALQYADSANMGKKMREVYQTWRNKDSVDFLKLNIEFDHFRFPWYSYINMATGPWYRYFIKYDAEKTMSKIRVPVLALNGDKDLMVAYQPNLNNWKNYPAENGNADVTTVAMPGLNHLFLVCKECTQEEIPELTTGFSTDALKIISEWINKKFNN